MWYFLAKIFPIWQKNLLIESAIPSGSLMTESPFFTADIEVVLDFFISLLMVAQVSLRFLTRINLICELLPFKRVLRELTLFRTFLYASISSSDLAITMAIFNLSFVHELFQDRFSSFRFQPRGHCVLRRRFQPRGKGVLRPRLHDTVFISYRIGDGNPIRIFFFLRAKMV